MSSNLTASPPYVDTQNTVVNPSYSASTNATDGGFYGNQQPDTLSPNNVNRFQNLIDGLTNIEAMVLQAGVTPSFCGYNFWSMPAQDANVALSATAITSAKGMYALVPITKAVTLSSLALNVSVAGGTLTAGSNFAQIFSLTGASLGYTGTQATNWATAGLYNVALTATATGTLAVNPASNPYVVVIAFLTGSTLPRFLGTSSAVGSGLWPVPSSISGTGSTIPQLSGYYSTFTATGTAATIADYTSIDGCNFWVGLT